MVHIMVTKEFITEIMLRFSYAFFYSYSHGHYLFLLLYSKYTYVLTSAELAGMEVVPSVIIIISHNVLLTSMVTFKCQERTSMKLLG